MAESIGLGANGGDLFVASKPITIWEPPKVQCPKHGPSAYIRFELPGEPVEYYCAACWRDELRALGAGPFPIKDGAGHA